MNVKNDVFSKYYEEIIKLPLKSNANKWWLCFHKIDVLERYENDFYHYILFEKNAVENISEQIINMIKVFESGTGLISRINKSEILQSA
ncbi:MAG: hypothetical protein WBM99_14700 [Psychromonas sp.]